MLAFPAVVDPGGFHLDHAGTGGHISLLGVTVADDQAFARLVDEVGMGIEVSAALGQ